MGQCMSGAAERGNHNPYGVKDEFYDVPSGKRPPGHGVPPPMGSAHKHAKHYYEPAADTKAVADEDMNDQHNHGADSSVVKGLAGLYKVQKLLGSGAEGNTYLVRDVSDGRKWAIKLINLPLPTRMIKSLYREIKLQSELGEGHRNIITPEEVVLTTHYLGLVMEYAPGGALTSYLMNKMRENRMKQHAHLLMQEGEARFLFRQITNAVDYCHRHRVAHRDLKLDNTLLTDDECPIVKLCDFGFARGWDENAHFTTVLGTPDYMSPQIASARAKLKEEAARAKEGAAANAQALGPVPEGPVSGPSPAGAAAAANGRNVYDSADSPTPQAEAGPNVPAPSAPAVSYDGTKADVWALGVLLTVMVTAKFPFDAVDVTAMDEGALSKMSEDMMTQVWRTQSTLSWSNHPQMRELLPLMSKSLKDLLDKIFELDEHKRITVNGIKEHPWFNLPLKTEHEAVLRRLEKEEFLVDNKIAAGLFHSERRDKALKELIELASSEEFKKRASEPVTAHTTFQLWSRIGLRTAQETYHVPNMKSLQQLIGESDKLSTPVDRRKRSSEDGGMTAQSLYAVYRGPSGFAQSRSMMEVKPTPMMLGTSTPPTTSEKQFNMEETDGEQAGAARTKPIPGPSNKPSKAIFRPRPDLGFRSMMHGSGGETRTGKPDPARQSVDAKRLSGKESSGTASSGSGPLPLPFGAPKLTAFESAPVVLTPASPPAVAPVGKKA